MKILITIILTAGFISLQVTSQESVNNVISDLHSNKTDTKANTTIKIEQNSTTIKNKIKAKSSEPPETKSVLAVSSKTQGINYKPSTQLTSILSTLTTSPPPKTITTSTFPSSSSPLTTSPLAAATPAPTEGPSSASSIPSQLQQYCSPTLCEFYNGTHTNIKPHIACKNSGNFSLACGSQPHLLKMSERRRNLILDLHNLARSRIASGQVDGYKSASHMPQLKWDNELEYLASLHVKRCRFEHDLCHNTLRFPYSGQNIGYFWKGVNITSHSKRMKNFIVNWYKEHKDANQSFIDSFHLHPDKKVIGHFTAMISDRIHSVGCAAVRFYESDLTKILMTCNYDFNNFLNEPVYQAGPKASKCAYKISKKYSGLCDWKKPTYDYEPENNYTESSGNLLFRE